MEYPFTKCPTPNSNKDIKGVWNIEQPEPENIQQSDSPEMIVQLIKQTLKIQEECMELLNLLVEFVECKSIPSDNESNLISFTNKNRLFT